MCAWSFTDNNHPVFDPTNEQESSPRMQMDRGEVEVEEARQTRVRRASILTTDKK